MQRDLLTTLKKDAKLCLQTIYPITSNLNINKFRFVTYDINTVLLDLIQCIENGTQKREKRYKRIQFLTKICTRKNINCGITELTKKKLEKVKKLIQNNDTNTISNIFSMFSFNIFKDAEIQASLYLLQSENKIDLDDDALTSFKKIDKDILFLPPEKQEFNNHCKSILNEDGYVYDIFSYVAIIMFYELLKDRDNIIYDEIHRKIFESCYLVFKGGAAVGKHIIQNDDNIWNNMNDQEQAYLINDFIKGGDNDTSIHISKLALLPDYRIDYINKAIGYIMLQLPIYMNKVLVKYNIKSLISNNITDITNSTFNYANTDFLFRNRESSSYAIVDDEYNKSLIKKQDYAKDKNQLYNTMSYVEFYTNQKNITKFYLARIKCAIKSEPILLSDDTYSDLKINCYAECLDVSCTCIDSADVIEEINYINITDGHILFKY